MSLFGAPYHERYWRYNILADSLSTSTSKQITQHTLQVVWWPDDWSDDQKTNIELKISY